MIFSQLEEGEIEDSCSDSPESNSRSPLPKNRLPRGHRHRDPSPPPRYRSVTRSSRPYRDRSRSPRPCRHRSRSPHLYRYRTRSKSPRQYKYRTRPRSRSPRQHRSRSRSSRYGRTRSRSPKFDSADLAALERLKRRRAQYKRIRFPKYQDDKSTKVIKNKRFLSRDDEICSMCNKPLITEHIYCEICKICAPDPASFEQHRAGKSHAKRIKRQFDSEVLENVSNFVSHIRQQSHQEHVDLTKVKKNCDENI